MKPAITSKRHGENTRLLVVHDKNAPQHKRLGQLHELLHDGDLLVFNRSGTLPSSFHGRLQRSNESLEIRLASFAGSEISDLSEWWAISFANGTWKQKTEERINTPLIQKGDIIIISSKLHMEILEVQHNRILKIKFHSENLFHELYTNGRPIQYSYLEEELNVWDQQTLMAGPPISVEAPSTAFPFTWNLILQLQKKGLKMVHLLHGAGISSTGDAQLDAKLPLEEWYQIPATTLQAIQETKANKGRVIAIGTTVVRALESFAQNENLNSNAQELTAKTNLRITEDFEPKIVDLLITGMHEEGSSHMDILYAFCKRNGVQNAYNEARLQSYNGHEYGDLSLLDCQKCS